MGSAPAIAQIQHEDPYYFVYDGIPAQHRVLKEQLHVNIAEQNSLNLNFVPFVA